MPKKSKTTSHNSVQAKNRPNKSKAARPKVEIVSKIRGKGDYNIDNSSSFGARLGALLGDGAQKLIKTITGFGEYHISSNSISNRHGPPPQFLKNGGAVSVTHREFLTDITSSTDFNLHSFPINPGVDTTFPWLSSLAENFEEYRMRGIVFEFISTSATAVSSTNTALGAVILATSYDPDSPAFPDKQTMESTLFVDSGKPADSMVHAVECDPKVSQFTVLKTRTSADVPSTLIPYDMGLFQIATAGMQAASVIGELWVTYDVELLKPRLRGLDRHPFIYIEGSEQDPVFDTSAVPFGINPVLAGYGSSWVGYDPDFSPNASPFGAGQRATFTLPKGAYFYYGAISFGSAVVDSLDISLIGPGVSNLTPNTLITQMTAISPSRQAMQVGGFIVDAEHEYDPITVIFDCSLGSGTDSVAKSIFWVCTTDPVMLADYTAYLELAAGRRPPDVLVPNFRLPPMTLAQVAAPGRRRVPAPAPAVPAVSTTTSSQVASDQMALRRAVEILCLRDPPGSGSASKPSADK